MMYYFPEQGEGKENARSLDSRYCDTEEFALAAIEHEFDCNDGWELEFPTTINIIDFNQEEDIYIIDLEMKPEFSATRL